MNIPVYLEKVQENMIKLFNKEIFDEALLLLIKAFVGEEEYNNYLNDFLFFYLLLFSLNH